MGAFLVTLIAGVAAGAWTARTVARREVEALRRQLSGQTGLPATPPPARAPVPAAVVETSSVAPPPGISEEITPEILMVLSAAVAAFFGKKAKLRRARISNPSGSAWAQQGRVFVQASHNLPTPHHH